MESFRSGKLLKVLMINGKQVYHMILCHIILINNFYLFLPVVLKESTFTCVEY